MNESSFASGADHHSWGLLTKAASETDDNLSYLTKDTDIQSFNLLGIYSWWEGAA